MIIENISCPLCSELDTKFISKYPGTFLSCRELHQCNNCSLIFCDEMPSNEELKKYYSSGLYYDLVSDPYNPDIVEFSNDLALSRLNLIKKETGVLNKKCKTLDIGAGNASFGITLKALSRNTIYDVVEPDIKVWEGYSNEVNKKFSDISDVKESDYDLVVLNQVLEHVLEPKIFIQSICDLLKEQGILYIDVPFKDYMFKSAVEPHILFWTPQSLSFLMKSIGFKLIFCSTVGMKHEKAKNFFYKKTMFDKIYDPLMYMIKINQIMKKIDFPKPFNTFRQFHANEYGGNRQWLRCIAQKGL